jgi:hypothetical protein
MLVQIRNHYLLMRRGQVRGDADTSIPESDNPPPLLLLLLIITTIPKLRPRSGCGATEITTLTDQVLDAEVEITSSGINIVPEVEAPEVVFGHSLVHGGEPEGEGGEGGGR